MIEGIDISHHQGHVDFAQVVASGRRFVFAKATEGNGMVDDHFATYRDQSAAHNLHFAGYHFFHFDVDWGDQAHLFLQTLGTLRDGEMAPVLDLEQQTYRDGKTGVSKIDGARRALAWLATVKTTLRVDPIVYCDRDFAEQFLQDPGFAGYPLWLAAYRSAAPATPPPWKKISFWQYAEHGHCPGVSGDCDLDRFLGDHAAFATLCRGAKP